MVPLYGFDFRGTHSVFLSIGFIQSDRKNVCKPSEAVLGSYSLLETSREQTLFITVASI